MQIRQYNIHIDVLSNWKCFLNPHLYPWHPLHEEILRMQINLVHARSNQTKWQAQVVSAVRQGEY
jgi:hypothetical protein